MRGISNCLVLARTRAQLLIDLNLIRRFDGLLRSLSVQLTLSSLVFSNPVDIPNDLAPEQLDSLRKVTVYGMRLWLPFMGRLLLVFAQSRPMVTVYGNSVPWNMCPLLRSLAEDRTKVTVYGKPRVRKTL